MMPIKFYIDRFYGGNQSRFAKAQGITPQTVNRWISDDFIVVNHNVYSPRRKLTPPPSRRA